MFWELWCKITVAKTRIGAVVLWSSLVSSNLEVEGSNLASVWQCFWWWKQKSGCKETGRLPNVHFEIWVVGGVQGREWVPLVVLVC